MEFAFSDEQVAFRDAVRALLAKECPPEVVRGAWPDGSDAHGAKAGEGARAEPAAVQAVWAALADMGVLGVAVPEDRGGLGLTEIDWVLLAEETGYAGLPFPFVETACVVAPLLAAGEATDPRLDALLDGSLLATCVVQNSSRPESVVPWLEAAGIVVQLSLGNSSGWTANELAMPLPAAIGSTPLDGSRGTALLADGDTGRTLAVGAAANSAFERGALATAAQLIGLGRRMLDLSVEYAIERRQFGVPIGSQQAVKHHLADAALHLQFAAPAVYRAAWSLANDDPSAVRDVAMAKAMASDAARLAGRKAMQVHGAIGYTVEYDLHLYFKRAEALARSWGDAAWHRRRVADAIGI